MTTLANILPFRPRSGPCAGNVVRSECYQAQLERETAFARALVERMEAELFRRGRDLPPSRKGILPHKTTEFPCLLGTLWYYYSPARHRYVLIEYSLHSGGSGGERLLCLAGGERRPVRRTALGRATARSGRLAAIGGRAAAALLSFLPRWMVALFGLPAGPARMLPWWQRVRSASNEILREIVLLRRAIASPRSGLYPTVLPKWSLLRRFVAVREQLDNNYAWSILAGEALCRLAREAELARLVTTDLIWEGHTRDDDLLEDSKAVIDAIFGDPQSPLPRKALRYFTTRFAFGDDFLTDDRRLMLVKSEMTLRIAASVARNATIVYRDLDGDVAESSGHDHDIRLMHRYARLSDFVRLSNICFGMRHSASRDLSIVDDLGYGSESCRSEMVYLVAGLADFGSSSSYLVDLLTKVGTGGANPGTLTELRSRLAALASEILDRPDEPR